MEALQQVRKTIKSVCILDNSPQASNTQWTTIEMLERSRYIVTQLQEDWDEEQQEIMNHLFEKYPTYQKAYQLTYTLRKWYHKTNVGKNIDFIEAKLYDWCDDVIASKLTPFKAIKKMIEKHWQDILVLLAFLCCNIAEK